MDKFNNRTLQFHSSGASLGLIDLKLNKPLSSTSDLALAYSPGVAEIAFNISKNFENTYDYNNIGNMIAIVSNGSAALGLGNIGAVATKLIMKVKAAHLIIVSSEFSH